MKISDLPDFSLNDQAIDQGNKEKEQKAGEKGKVNITFLIIRP